MKILVLLIWMGVMTMWVPAQPSRQSARDCNTSIFCPGEELVYEVTWLKIPLGQVRLRADSSGVSANQILYHASAFIDSYSGLPFVDLHAIDHTQMDAVFYSR
ncbi:MAG TPA: hypothetical protein VMH23_18735, partial [Bacteroidota bacterium]|nr:hypothetical protein [Bacteroidota bacterium]